MVFQFWCNCRKASAVSSSAMSRRPTQCTANRRTTSRYCLYTPSNPCTLYTLEPARTDQSACNSVAESPRVPYLIQRGPLPSGQLGVHLSPSGSWGANRTAIPTRSAILHGSRTDRPRPLVCGSPNLFRFAPANRILCETGITRQMLVRAGRPVRNSQPAVCYRRRTQ